MGFFLSLSLLSLAPLLTTQSLAFITSLLYAVCGLAEFAQIKQWQSMLVSSCHDNLCNIDAGG